MSEVRRFRSHPNTYHPGFSAGRSAPKRSTTSKTPVLPQLGAAGDPNMFGVPGTRSSLVLRLAQCACCATGMVAVLPVCVLVNNIMFINIRWLGLVMVLQFFWSFILALLDIYALITKWDLHRANKVWTFVFVDWLFAIFMYSGVSSSAGVFIFMQEQQMCHRLPCNQYKVSIILAAMAWLFSAASAASTFRLAVAVFQ